ncbi:MAG: hypothetical protein RBQ72_05730 [Desulfobacterium sp.]|jgi:hypothetical protein|nr:hypothetical protein [Desulfobacterium sp.]
MIVSQMFAIGLGCCNACKLAFPFQVGFETYDRAIRTFLDILGISSPEELRSITHGHVIAFKKFLGS